MFKLINLLFYILTFLSFSLIGMITSKFLGMADGQGLAGGAIILGHGIITRIIAFIISIFISTKFHSRTIKRINKIYLFILSIFILVGLFRILTIEEKGETDKNLPRKPTQPAEVIQ